MDSGSKNALRTVIWLAVVAIVAAAVWYMPRDASSSEVTPRIALVTADGDPYWDAVVLGAQEAARRHNAELSVIKAKGTTNDQTAILADLEGYDAIAVSPVDGRKQGVLLREIANQVPLVTIDSDSSVSDRVCFVGTDNYTAGRRCGQMIKQALPEGGQVAIVAGPLDKENGRDRRQGIIDELLDRPYIQGREPDALDAELASNGFEIVATLVDETTPETAQANVAAVLEAHPEVDCIVGIYAYNAPAALAVVTEAGKGEDVTIIGFDDNEATLAGIEAGTIFGTVAQDQFNYGYDAIRLLSGVAAADGQVHVPLDRKIHFPVVLVTNDNLAEFKVARRGSLMGLHQGDE